MALKSKLTKTEFDALPDALKEHYKASGDNYLLESDDAAELRAAKDRETEERKREKERADKLQLEKDEAERLKRDAELAKAKKDKDVEALEASWKQEKDNAVAAERLKTEKREAQLREVLVENEAIKLADEISTSPVLILPHIRARLRAELDGEKAVTRVLDEKGEVSAKTLADLKKELVDNAAFKAIIKASNASGGGAGGGGGSGSGATDKKFTDLTETERTAIARENPVKFREMAKAAGVTLPH
jgi:alanyl-tRNA synthetase